jgi:hypothetical protein
MGRIGSLSEIEEDLCFSENVPNNVALPKFEIK